MSSEDLRSQILHALRLQPMSIEELARSLIVERDQVGALVDELKYQRRIYEFYRDHEGCLYALTFKREWTDHTDIITRCDFAHRYEGN